MRLRLLKPLAAMMFISASLPSASFAQDSTTHEAIEATLNNYLNGSSYNRPSQIKSAFYPESDMFLHHGEKPIYRMNSLKYAALFEKRERGVFNGRYGKILDIDISGNIATAKAEILMPNIKARFFDVFILKQLDGEWKIISKAADRTESKRSGERFLLMVHKTQNLTDIIKAYEKAVSAGYTVNIFNAAEGPVTLSKVNMTTPKHKAYLYDADFMYALKHPLTLGDVTPDDYASAKRLTFGFWGGKENPDALKLYTAICEETVTCAQ